MSGQSSELGPYVQRHDAIGNTTLPSLSSAEHVSVVVDISSHNSKITPPHILEDMHTNIA